MRYLKELLTIGVCLVATMPATASSYIDLETCRWIRTGEIATPKACNDARAEAARDAEVAKNQQIMLEQQRKAQADFEAKRAAQEAKENEEAAVRRAEYAKQEAEVAKYRENLFRQEEQAEANKKKRCGKNYMVLKVGLSFDQVEKCFGMLSFVTETTAKSGVVETYRTSFYLIQFMNDRVVAFTRR